MKIALVGNPNVGKSTLFNRLTGLNQRVGNYPGTTVDKRVGKLTIDGENITLYDYPGTYSLYPKSKDEEVVFNILSHPKHTDFPDKVYVIGNPLHLKRSLLLYRQIQDLNIPVNFVVNMMDLVDTHRLQLNTDLLHEFSNSKVLYTNARNGDGMDELKQSFTQKGNSSAKSFNVPQLYQQATQAIKTELNLGSDYLAYQYAAHPETLHLSVDEKAKINSIRSHYQIVPARLQVAETLDRYQEIDQVVDNIVVAPNSIQKTITDKLDAVLMHPFWGYVVFFLILLLVFQAIFTWSSVPMDWIDGFFASLQSQAHNWFGEGPLASLIADGIIPGIGGIVIFVPQITILIFFLLILEETGYMSRVVYLMDKWMRPFGLSGKSVVPLMSGAACAIPGVMATRNIENFKERLTTILVTPFMTCSARLPVYAILIALVIPKKRIGIFDQQGLALMAMYILGILAALFFAYICKISLKSEYKSYLVMELPEFKWPQWRNLLLGLWEKVSAFVFGAGKVILAVSILLWVLSSWGPSDNFKNADNIIAEQAQQKQWYQADIDHHLESYKLENSMLGIIGKTIEPVFKPLGYDWKISIGVLSSFAAREVFVGTMATIYSIGSDTEEETTIVKRLENETRPNGQKVYNLATGVSLLLFYAFAMQCLSTVAVVQKETKGWKWPIIQLVVMSGFAYLVAFLAYQLLK